MHYPETLDFAKRHPVGSQTTARYNPDQPSESVLEPGPHPTKPHGGLVIAALAVFVSLAAVIFMAQDLP